MKVKSTVAILECLLEQGVDTIFGYPGGTILNIYDELYDYQDRLHHILTAHEQGAAHAADGYARATGKVGVCFATSGPGATNLTTGIATAYYDSSPVVFITCNVTENLLGKDAFQEVDITGIAMPITKATYLVRDPETIPDILREAFAVAATGRPGPVLIDFLKNETCSLISDAIYPEGGHCHPRVYDSFPRFLIKYVRDNQVFTVEEAIRKMTSLPASVFHLDRGVLEAGKEADICVFHLENLKSHATFSHPDQLCTGFDHVFTAGVPVVIQDRWTGTGAGEMLKSDR